jgi:hypothetical protein
MDARGGCALDNIARREPIEQTLSVRMRRSEWVRPGQNTKLWTSARSAHKKVQYDIQNEILFYSL